MRNLGPKMVKGHGDSLIVRHREFCGDIRSVSSDLFEVQAFAGQPGVSSLMSWPNHIALLYDTYRMNKLKLIYEPTCPTSTVGALYMYLDTDPTDEPPTNKVQASSSQGCVRGPVWSPIEYEIPLEMLRKRPKFFTRTGPIKEPGSYLDYDFGNVFVCNGNITNTNLLLGELWVEYEIEFLTPELSLQAPTSKNIEWVAGGLPNIFQGSMLVSPNNFSNAQLSPAGAALSTKVWFLYFLVPGSYHLSGKVDSGISSTAFTLQPQPTSDAAIYQREVASITDTFQDQYFTFILTVNDPGQGVVIGYGSPTTVTDFRLNLTVSTIPYPFEGPLVNTSITSCAYNYIS